MSRPFSIAKIIMQDPAANRWADQLMGILNPMLRGVGGDLKGPVTAPTVIGLYGLPLDPSMGSPAVDNVPKWNGSAWVPGTAGTAGAVTAVTALAPLSSSGGTTPQISLTGNIPVAQVTGAVSSVTAVSPLSSTGGTTPQISLTGNIPATQISGTLAANQGGTGNNSYSVGDILFASSTSALSRRAIGTLNQVLTSNGSTPVWQTPTASFAGAGIGFYRAVNSSPATVGLTDYVVDVTVGGSFVVNLPTAGAGVSQAANGRVFIIKNSGGATVTVTPGSSQTIDGATSLVIVTQYSSFTLTSTGSGWVLT